MLAAAKADLEPDLGGVRLHRLEIERRAQVQGECGQKRFEQGRLARLDRSRLDPSKASKRPVRKLGHGRELKARALEGAEIYLDHPTDTRSSPRKRGPRLLIYKVGGMSVD
jgi:hypothetical protein